MILVDNAARCNIPVSLASLHRVLPYVRHLHVLSTRGQSKLDMRIIAILSAFRPPRDTRGFLAADPKCLGVYFRRDPAAIERVTGIKLEWHADPLDPMLIEVPNPVWAHMRGRSWAQSLRLILPSLTHLSISVVNFYLGAGHLVTVPELAGELMVTSKCLLLRDQSGSTLQVVCLRLGGCLLAEVWKDHVPNIIAQLKDTRLRVWYDSRVPATVEELSEADQARNRGGTWADVTPQDDKAESEDAWRRCNSWYPESSWAATTLEYPQE
ncbi:hypothetical protein BKA62DRAFT_833046 [Auriculariales sp. MPI-PUGE-AT-0066]|nr:hypothetical protein BKA62DRAFT_833046 [Auriculariales sp. MPI-PUGE-AT-0066]